MTAESISTDYAIQLRDLKPLIQTNPFAASQECVLKTCCKKYKKGKRCKKCPD